MEPKERIVITAKDVQIYTGKKLKACYRLLRKIKEVNHKEKHQFLTFEEFFAYMGITPPKRSN